MAGSNHNFPEKCTKGKLTCTPDIMERKNNENIS